MPCQVRGTPASGKTSLAELVSHYIRQQEPATNLIWIQGWSYKPVDEAGWQLTVVVKPGAAESRLVVSLNGFTGAFAALQSAVQ